MNAWFGTPKEGGSVGLPGVAFWPLRRDVAAARRRKPASRKRRHSFWGFCQEVRRRLAIHTARLAPQPIRANDEGSGTALIAVPGEPVFWGVVEAER